jgi:DNA mismatch endonuclease (patch repair protein)
MPLDLDLSMRAATPERSKQMSLIRSKGNKTTEMALVQLLRCHRITGWRRHRRITTTNDDGTKFVVRPDFVFSAFRLAVFVDGCFWHGCCEHCRIPKSNRVFWQTKIQANRSRDRLVNARLRKAGWKVLRIWEHGISHPRSTLVVSKLRTALSREIKRVSPSLSL